MARLTKELTGPFFDLLVRDARKAAREYGVHSLLTDATANPKVAKNGKIAGVLTAPMHLSPARLSGYQVCPMATAGCVEACLHTAGNPAYMKGKFNARNNRTRFYFGNRPAFMVLLAHEIKQHRAAAKRARMLCGVRLNATSDIPWESVSFTIEGKRFTLPEAFPDVQFYDYTKRANRLSLPPNYSLTFSLAENNDADALSVLQRGGNVVGREFALPIVKADIHSVNNRLLDFRADIPFGFLRQPERVVILQKAVALAEMHGENFLALLLRRQIEKENLVEPPFAQEFRRQRADVVRRRHHEAGGGFFLHPRQNRAENAGACATVQTSVMRQPFFHLVNPDDARRDGFGER